MPDFCLEDLTSPTRVVHRFMGQWTSDIEWSWVHTVDLSGYGCNHWMVQLQLDYQPCIPLQARLHDSASGWVTQLELENPFPVSHYSGTLCFDLEIRSPDGQHGELPSGELHFLGAPVEVMAPPSPLYAWPPPPSEPEPYTRYTVLAWDDDDDSV